MKICQHNIILDFEQNGTGPAILFIHDNEENTAITDQRFVSLAKAGFRVILTNLRGLAQSGETTIDALTGDAVALLNYLGIGRAVIFGIGRGGCVLLNLLEKHPERIVASSLVIPPAMAKSLHHFTGRKRLLKRLQTENAAALIQKLFKTLPVTPPSTTPLSELPGLGTWLDQVATLSQQPGKAGMTILAELKLPLLLIANTNTPTAQRWRQRLGGRLRAFNASLLALLDLIAPGESEEFDDEVLAELH